ncbi:protein phosphatase [Nocardioides aromaticivorans]|uniref:Protein phosphatase n=1 Tax=Nocardioides aromaticivorans TaxID=200618 RepID=A0ABX7PDV4_9ACTN|nr:protein phosphatase 2C domain-containing protein [Nocardioides aromaticivorans]QSR24066.1 protein phosphatase [Nocardioides aromaticivorans]
MAPTPDGTTPEDVPLEDSPLDSTAPDTVENPEAPERPTPDPTAEVPEVFQQDTVDAPAKAPKAPLSLDFYAVSDVGRVRKDNQDSGYAGPWLLSVCDGVGGAARGDIASGTAVNELRQLDEPPGSADVLDRVSDGIHEAHVAIGNQVDQDPSLNGTSTTATVALFDGTRLALGHVGDSRAYLLRDGELSQLTNDHTFVQSLIDEGRITAEEARVHPHRNLILKALDGLHDVEPDLFALELVAGDRLFLCSDGACGVLDDPRITEILADGSPEFSAIEMVRASLDAGSSDNVTCVVADVAEAVPDAVPHEPMIVGAAADLRQRRPRALFRGHRSGDTGELEPVAAEIPEGIDYAIRADPPADPEAMRYAPQAPPRFIWPRRLLGLAVLVGLVWVVLGTAYWWSQRQYYVGEDDGKVVIYRGVEVPGLSSVHEVSDISVDDLPDGLASSVEDGIPADDYDAARDKVQQIAGEVDRAEDPADESPEPSTTPDPTSPATPDPTGDASDFAPVE